MVSYEPAPIDTSGVTLTAELEELTELLASNVHDLWAVSYTHLTLPTICSV